MKRKATAVLIVAAAAVVAAYALLRFGPWRIGDPLLVLDMVMGRGVASPTSNTVALKLVAAPGYEARLYQGDIRAARWLAMTPAGDLLVARTRDGVVEILAGDANGDGRPDARRVLLGSLDSPHGLAVHDGWLYVAERKAVGRIPFDAATGATSGTFTHVVTGLTGDGNHQSRTIGFGPDGKLYLSQGSTCNVCEERDHRRATMMRFDPDGTHAEIYATGLRNSVGFDWAPWDGALYATENGRDLLGDDFPPDELNRIEPGRFYGWPYINGNNVLDPDLGRGHEALLAQSVPPVHAFRAHNAPLGIVFLRSPSRPPEYERVAIVALHGSWNRSALDGYKVVSLHWRDDGSIDERDFVTGFLGDAGVIGRPAGVAEGPDGAVYVADDYAGAIYRVAPTHQAQRR